MLEDEHTVTLDYYCSIMTEDDVLPLKGLVSRIHTAPRNARNYLERRCNSVRELEEFFRDNSHLFFVMNGRVALNSDELEADCKKTVKFFRGKLKALGRRIHFMKLKDDYWESAPDNVCSFITRFFPGKEFKHFLRTRPDVFVLHSDHTVFLIEVECVDFYKSQLKSNPNLNMYFLNFRGRMSLAEPHIQKYINKYYHGDDFQIFLKRNSHVFVLDKDLNVRLAPFV